MLNYLECSEFQFKEAMRMVREDVKISDFPSDLLYIAYTKYCADTRNIDTGTSYAYEIYIETKKRRDQFKQELVRRGMKI